MITKLTLSDLVIQNKKVLMRVDFNVPLTPEGEIADDTRIRAAMPSIQYVLDHGGALILMSHLGRPKGKVVKSLTLASCAIRLSQLLGREVKMASDCVGESVQEMVSQLQPGQVLLLENLRFHKGEEKPDQEPNFTQQLASLGDLYVNDAFGTAHRSHASTTRIASLFPGKAAAGFLLEREIRFLGNSILNPKRPFYAIIGGAKISTKLGALKALINKADALLIGGGMSYTFFKAKGIPIGLSICEDQLIDEAKQLMALAEEKKVPLILPKDLVVTNNLKGEGEYKFINLEAGIPDNMEGVDIGPDTIHQFGVELKNGATVFWNGPLGVFEVPPFDRGTMAIAHLLPQLNITSIVGGGDSIAALQQADVIENISHISTGGGASLEYIEFGTLPGIEALSNRKELMIDSN